VELMIKLRDLEGVTSVFVTHDLRAAALISTQYADVDSGGNIRIVRDSEHVCLININYIMLLDGKILFEGNLHELKASQESYIQNFVI
jgi:phospholipid/cholesterol/gamma-HCH transport system ATP-binding protein